MRTISSLLRDPSLDGIDIDSSNRLQAHRHILSKKPILQQVFTEFHHNFRRLEDRYLSGNGIKVELGAGIAPIRDTYHDVMATDIVMDAYLDKVIDAQCMDLDNNSVKVIYGQNFFHHLPKPELFFSELMRVLEPGGGAILLEPYYGPFASFLYKRLFRTEGFDKQFESWETPVNGPMNGANQALSYLVFVRDREEFENKYPNLKIVHQQRSHNYLKYLLSGGLNFRQLIPDWMSPLIAGIQYGLLPLDHFLCLHHYIVIRKES